MKVAVLPVAALCLMQCARVTAAVDVAGTLPGAVMRNCIFLYSGYPALETKERSTRNQALRSRGGSEHADVSSCTFAVGGK